MYKAIKDNKIIAISDVDNNFFCLVKDVIVEDTVHVVDDYDQYNGEYLLKSDITAPTYEEQKEKRRQAYILEKDPITCQIQSLRDEEQTDKVVEEINQLLVERAQIVSEIKERYPYPEGV